MLDGLLVHGAKELPRIPNFNRADARARGAGNACVTGRSAARFRNQEPWNASQRDRLYLGGWPAAKTSGLKSDRSISS